MTESQKVRDKVDGDMRGSYANLKEMNDKATTFAEDNVSAGFELAQKLLDAKDPRDIARVLEQSLRFVALSMARSAHEAYVA